ncbi:MFS transporter [Paenarthrobacter nitroguajacolicus]|uniref:MFS transporter n=1 Tax=Paenarthrobacter nitroguajacolicus TaxID=211146 RepID=UPI00248AF9B0|nr:MFS transporter [Paenarthrobacter nitroguajacolicus]MDI2035599.1 hypothetical protein [Paenarthrobacter nitroguajacolicus]
MLAATTAMMAGASAPSPFYPAIQARFGFAPVVVTAVFAVYAVTLLAALLVAGSISDHVGRRPVISASFGLLALSMVLFWLADGATSLLISRALQGLASGLLLSTLSATIVDFEHPGRPGSSSTWNSMSAMAGLAIGPLLGGLALLSLGGNTGSAATFLSLAAIYLALAVAAWSLPETSARRSGIWASLVPRVSMPSEARKAFFQSTPAFIAGWATGGLYLSLGTSIVALQFHQDSPLARSLVVTSLAGCGALAGFLMRKRTSRSITLYGTFSLAVGSATTLLALALGSLELYYIAVMITGTGFGTAFPGSLQGVMALVSPGRRAQAMAAIFVVCYIAFSVPAVVAGLMIPAAGLLATASWYGGVIMLLAAASAVFKLFGRH